MNDLLSFYVYKMRNDLKEKDAEIKLLQLQLEEFKSEEISHDESEIFNLKLKYNSAFNFTQIKDSFDPERCRFERSMGYSRSYEHWSEDETKDLLRAIFVLGTINLEELGSIFKRHPKAIIYRLISENKIDRNDISARPNLSYWFNK